MISYFRYHLQNANRCLWPCSSNSCTNWGLYAFHPCPFEFRRTEVMDAVYSGATILKLFVGLSKKIPRTMEGVILPVFVQCVSARRRLLTLPVSLKKVNELGIRCAMNWFHIWMFLVEYSSSKANIFIAFTMRMSKFDSFLLIRHQQRNSWFQKLSFRR